MFETKTCEIGCWRKLHNKELHNLYHCKTSTWWSNEGGWDGQGMWCLWGKEKCM